MSDLHYTIGMAGHIDHGKTALTKALTNMDTDRLKEEKERNISIELGYAPLKLDGSNISVSVIDVPGHERFIRQMIAGVAGIDLVLIIIAADEGIMPQTKEHMDILNLLEIHNAIFVITKVDAVEEDLVEIVREDLQQYVEDTAFKHSPVYEVDSLSKKGIDALKDAIQQRLEQIPTKSGDSPFRMPIDNIFSLKGIGTIVRGTIYNGIVKKEDTVFVLPTHKKGKVRHLQVHHEDVDKALAGQRAAVNLAGIHKNELKRGHVLVKSDEYVKSSVVDIALTLPKEINYSIKQRTPIKFHSGASEIFGQIVFFDRNEVENTKEEIYCQVRLSEPIVISRGDRFIIRRATPVETIGGGMVINPIGEKYKFHEDTIKKLKANKEGTPEEHIIRLLKEQKWVPQQEMSKLLSLQPNTLQEEIDRLKEKGIVVGVSSFIGLQQTVNDIKESLHEDLRSWHEEHPMKQGINKAEYIQRSPHPKKVVQALLDRWIDEGTLRGDGHFIALGDFNPHFPKQWDKRMENVINKIEDDHLQVEEWSHYVLSEKIPSDLADDLKQLLIDRKVIMPLTDKLVIHASTLQDVVTQLKEKTGESFTLKEAKESLHVTRKYLIPLLELLDEQKWTKRVEQERKWIT
ncbi:selenocysteine-specific translation elongation factor [Salirhabdus salicampi]|uniref:selenocysteine-specific translation elongation factor n=1 Tax=Salirhabdus salicampi TaxID=476102 RepID=UPI0020C2D765|nr:selenocysteine-specific translation elongation factor [Salirhabdus salicampi]MCP8616416.1 selenocysteine-specific translation elongation factor [Salirhabdus salicampi]